MRGHCQGRLDGMDCGLWLLAVWEKLATAERFIMEISQINY